MTVQNQAQLEMLRSTLKRLLKAALATSCLSGVATVANAQTGFQLPTFPTETAALELPVASEPHPNAIEYPFPAKANESARPVVTASSKAIALLGLNKNGVAPRILTDAGMQSNTYAQASVPTFRLPVIAPSQHTAADTTAAQIAQSIPTQSLASGFEAGPSRTPSISNSSGKSDERKVTLTATPRPENHFAISDLSEVATTDPAPSSLVNAQAIGVPKNVAPVVVESEPIVLKFEDLASTVDQPQASEPSPSESLIDDLVIIEPSRNSTEPIREEVASAEEHTELSGSLIDIDIPLQVVQNVTAQSNDRMPEIVKTHAAMQLNVGVSNKTAAEPTQLEESNVAVAKVEPVVTIEPTVKEQVVTEPVVAALAATTTEPASPSLSDVAKTEPKKITLPALSATPISLPESPVVVAEQLSPVLLTSAFAEKTKEEPKLPAMPRPALISAVAVMPVIDEASPNPLVKSVVQASSSEFSDDSTVATIKAADPVVPASESSPAKQIETVQGEQLKLAINESITIESSLTIEKVSVEHPELCQALKGREHDVTLIGLRPGVTRVAVFTVDRSDVRKVEIHDVSIGDSSATQADTKNLASEITRTVRKMYPQSRVLVVATADGLSVQGVASSEEEAKRIVGLARKTSLQPVIDRVTVGR